MLAQASLELLTALIVLMVFPFVSKIE